MYDVTAIGEALIDFIPAQRDCALKEVESFTRVCGGAPTNVAAVVAKLQGNARLLTQVGNDAFGDYIVDTIKLAVSKQTAFAGQMLPILPSLLFP